ncbi:MAG TPA: response regulator, partial [candidate division Zixibacteria bacterium]|nr:response regulator [candidate division Zixibacteria bacterium]
MSKVLVADDSATIRGVAESLLRHNGYEVISTSDGNRALAMAKSQKPDLIFLDHVMPGKDGLTVCRELKADPQLRDIPVIMLLGAGEAREAEKFLTAGASDYLFKPFVPKDFIEKAQKFLAPFSKSSTITQDTGKVPTSSLLEEALSSATEEENLDLEKL